MKRMEVIEKQVGEYTFYIKRFAAFTASNISGELASLVGPLISALTAVIGSTGNEGDGIDLMNIDVDKAAPAIGNAFGSLSGDKVERLLKKLLIDYKNISVMGEATDGEVKQMDTDLANEVFCGEVQDMFILAFEVIRLNFNGFFKKLGTQFGNLVAAFQKGSPSTADSENLTTPDSQNLN